MNNSSETFRVSKKASPFMQPWGIQRKNRLETLASSHLFFETRPTFVKTTQFIEPTFGSTLLGLLIPVKLVASLRFYTPHLTLQFFHLGKLWRNLTYFYSEKT
jgi:hypothetical protein